MRRGMLSAFNDNSTFEAVLLRDVLSVSGLAFQHASDVIQFVYPATGVLVSRFLLDLQSANRYVLHLDSSFDPNVETIVFDHATFSAASLEAPGTPSHSSKGLDVDGQKLVSPDSEGLFSEHDLGTAGTREGKDLEGGVPPA
ncbi:hypothetical protein GSI_12507 [Ganoderma sinense ZZ0214-1]|uniref:Uncharacterized protein n=1 Tax=Ganoderma sinense ZZ0214-1 TaxID=1077348 RepID=A0A2G8RT02_9APHY|nr:hypothetical protein GSI_12507 [Ganoderma sinense ZZ0214-1]